MRSTIPIIGFAVAFAAAGAGAARAQQLIPVKPKAGGEQAAPAAPTDCTALGGSLTPPAQAVWRYLCAGEKVDLSKIVGADAGTFVDDIIADPSRQAMLKDARIRIENGTLDALTINGLEARSLTLTSVTIRNDLQISNSEVGDTVTLESVRVLGNIDIDNLMARRFRQSASAVDNSFCMFDSRLDRLSVDDSNDPNVGISSSQIGSLAVSHIGDSNMILSSLGGQDIDIRNSGKLRISLSESALGGNIRLLNDLWQAGDAPAEPRICGRSWQDKAAVVLSYVQAQELVLFSGFAGFRAPPLGVDHAKFDTVSFGPDPLPAIDGIGPVRTSAGAAGAPPQYLPFLAAAARNYATNGRADLAQEITYEINLRNKPPVTAASEIWVRGSSWATFFSAVWMAVVEILWRGLWLFRWISVGFGQRVEWGIGWIILFVAIGWLVFRTGRKALTDPNARPSSWVLFAIDSVVPVIHLDRRHDEVAFNGGRQWYLAFLRVMGAVLVFLVFYFLKQALLGGE